TAYINAHEAGWRNPKHRQQWKNTLATYGSPVVGKLPVSAVDTGLVLKVLEPIWSRKPETASRVRGRIIIRTIPLGLPLYVRWKWLRSRLRFSRSICPFTILRTSNALSQAWQSNRMAGFSFRPTLPFSRFARRYRPFWHATAFPQSPHIRRLRQPEDWSPTVRIEPHCFANPLPMSTVFYAARN